MSELKIAMIGLDTSHCEGIAGHLNNRDPGHCLPGAKIMKAFPGGSDKMAVSRDRIEGFTAKLRDEYNIPMCNSIEEAADGMDAIILTSVDGRQHLEQVEVLARFEKPIFVDKPFACSVADAKAMIELSKKHNAPLMSSSTIRFASGVMEKKAEPSAIPVCETFGPMSILDDFPPYFWYGIHSADLLYLHMGRGCEEVRVIHEDTIDIMVGRWKDGRIGIVKGMRQESAKPFGRILYLEDNVDYALADMADPPCARTLLESAISFFRTGKSPIDIEETLEVMAFLEAAETSLKQNGAAVAFTTR